MGRHISWKHQGWVIGIVIGVAVLGVLAAISFVMSDNDDGGAPEALGTELIQVTVERGPSAEEIEVARVVDQFIEALATRDAETLYELQTNRYQQSCTLEDFRTVIERGNAPVVMGPARVEVQGETAGARVFLEGTPVVLPLTREQDGSWRIVPQTGAACFGAAGTESPAP